MFSSRLGFTDDQIDLLSQFALDVYLRKVGLAFSEHELVATVGEQISTALISSNTVIESAQHGSLTFYHQLLHDYLASRWIAHHEETWTPRHFDAISFDANTFESAFIVLDQLHDEDQVAQYITALYDWNWFGTIRCIERALRQGSRVPYHMTVVLSAMLGEKRFDPILGSRHRANEWSARLDRVTGFRFGQTSNVNELVAETGRVHGGEGPQWFTSWWKLFNRISQTNYCPTEAEIAEIASVNPFIGWTAAQVCRHCAIGEGGARQIRAVYRATRHAHDNTSKSIRWRTVHALGCHPSDLNAEILISAIDHDTYSWVVHGAVRSLLEMAVTSDSKTAEQFLAEMHARLTNLPSETLLQVAIAAEYDGAPPGWPASVLPLIESACNLQTNEKDKELWKRRVEVCRAWAARKVTNPEGQD